MLPRSLTNFCSCDALLLEWDKLKKDVRVSLKNVSSIISAGKPLLNSTPEKNTSWMSPSILSRLKRFLQILFKTGNVKRIAIVNISVIGIVKNISPKSRTPSALTRHMVNGPTELFRC